MSGGDFNGIERGSLGSRGSLPSCSTTTRVHGGAIGSPGATWPLPSFSSPISQLWFGRQVHATRMFIWSQLLLAAIAVILLVTISSGNLEPDKLNWMLSPLQKHTRNGESEPVMNKSDNFESGSLSRSRRSVPPPSVATSYESKRTWGAVLAGIAYFYIISIFLAWWGVQAAETRGRREEATDGECRATASAGDDCACSQWISQCGSASCLRRATILFLLTPWLLSVLCTLFIPLVIMTMHLSSQYCYYISENEKLDTFTYWGYELWYKILPLIVLWIIASYFFAACMSAFVFTWRRADGRFGGTRFGTMAGLRRVPPHRGVPLRESAAAASFSWTFRSTKDRARIISRDGDLNKSAYSVASNKSYKSTRNPTLRGYVRKTDDMDVSLISEENYAAGDSLERSYNNNGYNRRMTQSEQMRASRGFSGYSGAGVSRAPLEPVEEEEYTPTPEKTAENGDLRM